MKLLMIYSEKFSYFPRVKNLGSFENVEKGADFENVLLAFIHVEEKDEEDMKKVETKMVKNLKWAAKKNNTNKVVLHSFAHLSDSKANAEYTKELFDKVEDRMKNANYETVQTPFGYFLDINVNAPGVSQARIFKSF